MIHSLHLYHIYTFSLRCLQILVCTTIMQKLISSHEVHRKFTFPISFFNYVRYICIGELDPYHTVAHLIGPLQDSVKSLIDFCRNWNLYRFYPTYYELEPLIEILPSYANCNFPRIFYTTVFHQLYSHRVAQNYKYLKPILCFTQSYNHSKLLCLFPKIRYACTQNISCNHSSIQTGSSLGLCRVKLFFIN